MRLLFLALTWTAVVAGPLFQTATSGSGRESELQEATPGGVLQEMTTELQEATPGSVLQEMTTELQEATPGIVLQQISDDLNVDQYLQTYGYMNDVNERSENYDQRRTDALKSFQKFAGLQVTGEENEETRQQMLRPRCGMKDIEVERPSNIKWNITNITYGFKNYSPDLDKTSIHDAFKDVLGQWSNASTLTFTKIESGTPIIEISFVTRKHSGCPFRMDGPGCMLAHSFLPSQFHLGGDIHFDDDETFKYKDGRGIEIASVALHEVGHSLGLGHDGSRGSIMVPWYTGKTYLGINDRNKIYKLYVRKNMTGTVN